MGKNVVQPHERIAPAANALSSGTSFKIQLFHSGQSIGWLGRVTGKDNYYYGVIVANETDAISLSIYTWSDGNDYLKTSDDYYMTYSTNMDWVEFRGWGYASAWVFESDGTLLNIKNNEHLSFYETGNTSLYTWDNYTILQVQKG